MRGYSIALARAMLYASVVGSEELADMLPARRAKVDLAITVDRLLDQLAETKPEWCRLVEVKFFLGLTDEEAANALGMKLRTMQRMWLEARQWLFAHMGSENAGRG